MSLNAATIEILLAKGLTGDDLLAVARAMESEKKQSAAAKRQARYRERRAQGVTGDVTRTPKSNIKPVSSEANASVGEPTADPIKQVFDLGVEILKSTGSDEKQARSLLGKWRKAASDGEVLQGLLECRAKSIANPVEWLTKRFQPAKYVSSSGYEYRGSDEQVMREAEKRNDMGTFWKAKGNIKRGGDAKSIGQITARYASG